MLAGDIVCVLTIANVTRTWLLHMWYVPGWYLPMSSRDPRRCELREPNLQNRHRFYLLGGWKNLVSRPSLTLVLAMLLRRRWRSRRPPLHPGLLRRCCLL